MSEHSDPSEVPEPVDPTSNRSTDLLESLLKRLAPNPLDVQLVADLSDESAEVESTPSKQPAKLRWKRVAPLVVLSIAGLVGYGLIALRPLMNDQPSTPLAKETKASDSSVELPLDRFQSPDPQGYLQHAADRRVIINDENSR